MLAAGSVRRLGAGARMTRSLAAADEWFGVAQGVVKLLANTINGRQVVLSLAVAGDWFGSLPHLEDESERRLINDGETCTPVTLLAVPLDRLRTLAAREPCLTVVLAKLSHSNARRVFDMFTERVSLTAEQRVARQIQMLVKRFGIPCEGGVRIAPYLNQQDLANMLGASRQRVNVALKRFERDGWLTVKATGIEVSCAKSMAEASGLTSSQ